MRLGQRWWCSDALRRVFEGVVAKCIAAGLVGGRGIFIDACLIKAAVDKKKRVPGDQPIAWPKAEEASRALAQLRERKGGPCVSTVSIVCDPTGHLQGWARAGRQLSSQPGYAGTSGLLLRVGTGSTIADAADGADGVFGK